MKKFLSFMVAVVGLLPFIVSAKVELYEDFNCKKSSDGNTIDCEINANITSAVDTIEITLEEVGGAEITSISKGDEDWVLSKSESSGIHSIQLTTPNLDPLSGEYTLVKFSYVPSGLEGCSIDITLDGAKLTVTPPDEPTDNKDTGATLPYIALGAIALVAVGAYVVTKNKSKMYRI